MYVVSLGELRRRIVPWLRLLIIAGAVLGVLFVASRWFLPPRPAATPDVGAGPPPMAAAGEGGFRAELFA